MTKSARSKPRESAKEQLLNATLTLVRTKGYTATTIDAICEAAGVSKGAFFHHFKSKEDLAVGAAKHWSQVTGALFEAAPYHQVEDPLERLLAYVRFRKDLLYGELPQITCFVGTVVQEAYAAYPTIQQACRDSIFGHARSYEPYIEEAKAKYAPSARWNSESLALHIQGALQGAFILAKASGNVDVAVASIEHLERYLKLLFNQNSPDIGG